jgi:hypothetical protein
VAALKWNGWQHSAGIGGSFGPEYANIVYWICVKLNTSQSVQKDQLLPHETLKIK